MKSSFITILHSYFQILHNYFGKLYMIGGFYNIKKYSKNGLTWWNFFIKWNLGALGERYEHLEML